MATTHAQVLGDHLRRTDPPTYRGQDAVARALGAAWALGRQRRLPGRLRSPLSWPDDALATAVVSACHVHRIIGPVTAACLAAERGYAVPLVIVLEDDTVTAEHPAGWVRRLFEALPGLVYRMSDDGSSADVGAACAVARREGRPVLWHVLGSSGSAAPAAVERSRPVAVPSEPSEDERRRIFGGVLPEDGESLSFAETMDAAVLDAGLAQTRLVVVSADGHAVPPVSRRRLGASRVIEVPVDGRALVWLAQGAADAGLLPLVRISSVSTLAGAVTALVAGAQVTVRGVLPDGVDDEVSAAVSGFAHVDGAVVACPAHPGDASGTLACALEAARGGAGVVVLEPPDPHVRDLIEPGDGAWSAPYSRPGASEHVAVGRAAVWGAGADATVVAMGAGVRLAVQGATVLRAQGVSCRVVDLRWRRPLPVADVLWEAEATGRLVVLEHGRESTGMSEELVTACLEAGFGGRLMRLAPTPAADGAGMVPVTREALEAAVRALVSDPD